MGCAYVTVCLMLHFASAARIFAAWVGKLVCRDFELVSIWFPTFHMLDARFRIYHMIYMMYHYSIVQHVEPSFPLVQAAFGVLKAARWPSSDEGGPIINFAKSR